MTRHTRTQRVKKSTKYIFLGTWPLLPYWPLTTKPSSKFHDTSENRNIRNGKALELPPKHRTISARDSGRKWAMCRRLGSNFKRCPRLPKWVFALSGGQIERGLMWTVLSLSLVFTKVLESNLRLINILRLFQDCRTISTSIGSNTLGCLGTRCAKSGP